MVDGVFLKLGTGLLLAGVLSLLLSVLLDIDVDVLLMMLVLGSMACGLLALLVS